MLLECFFVSTAATGGILLPRMAQDVLQHCSGNYADCYNNVLLVRNLHCFA